VASTGETMNAWTVGVESRLGTMEEDTMHSLTFEIPSPRQDGQRTLGQLSLSIPLRWAVTQNIKSRSDGDFFAHSKPP
jgi:hypothetical protein